MNNIESSVREECLEDFYNRWAHVPLVVNKWLVLESCSELDKTFDKVQEIKASDRFDILNPNMVYSLVGGFGNNLGQFHRGDAKPYEFLKQIIVEIDKKNPLVAGRMIQPFTKFKKYDKTRQSLLIKQLEDLGSYKLSNDVGDSCQESCNSIVNQASS